MSPHDSLAPADRSSGSRRLDRVLAELERVIRDHVGRARLAGDPLDRAYARALALLDDRSRERVPPQVVLLRFVRDILCDVVVELSDRLPDVQALVQRLETFREIPVLELGREVLRAPALLELPADVAIEVQLTLLLAFGEARAVSLWTGSPAADPECAASIGDPKVEGLRTRQLARRLLAGDVPKPPRDSKLCAVTVACGEARAALIACGTRGSRARIELLLDAAIPVLTATLRPGDFASRHAAASGMANAVADPLVAAERRLARVRFDLHDGPQQDLILLAEDLRLFRSQLDSVLGRNAKRERLLSRIDDLEARLIALDGDLRRISVSAESPFLHGDSLQEAVTEIVDAFAARSGIEPVVRFAGDFTGLTDSQHITLLGLIRESLSNIREHSDADDVSILISSTRDGVDATVTDDGRGFDPETSLMRAAREGHLGLVGMHERVRLLGGQTQIESRPGGPTRISVSLPKAPDAPALT